jgi:hypothetical protein
MPGPGPRPGPGPGDSWPGIIITRLAGTLAVTTGDSESPVTPEPESMMPGPPRPLPTRDTVTVAAALSQCQCRRRAAAVTVLNRQARFAHATRRLQAPAWNLKLATATICQCQGPYALQQVDFESSWGKLKLRLKVEIFIKECV